MPEARLAGCLQWSHLSSGHTGANRSVDFFCECFYSSLTPTGWTSARPATTPPTHHRHTPHTTAASGPQPGVAGTAHHHRQRNSARSGGE